MSPLPGFLPPLLKLDGTWEEIVSKLYEIFTNDFRRSQPLHRGVSVRYNGLIKEDGQGKEEGFWAAISGHRNKEIDYKRAKRLHWCRLLIEHPDHPEILVFDYTEGPKDKGTRRHIWLKNYDYVVILQRKENHYRLVTAFYVDNDWTRSDLQRKYDHRDGQ